MGQIVSQAASGETASWLAQPQTIQRAGMLPPFGKNCFQNYFPGSVFVVPDGVTRIRVRIWGGGGGGGGTGGDGTAGGTSSFGALISATGGTGGTASTPGTGGTGVGGFLNTVGGPGGGTLPGGTYQNGIGGGGGAGLGDGGAGGSNYGGGAGRSGYAFESAPGGFVWNNSGGTDQIALWMQMRHIMTPRFPGEFFMSDQFYAGGNANHMPYAGRGGFKANGTSSIHDHYPDNGGGGAPGQDSYDSPNSRRNGMVGSFPGGGGGGGCTRYGGGGGGFACGIFDVTPGQVIPVTGGFGGTGGPQNEGDQRLGGHGAGGQIVVEW